MLVIADAKKPVAIAGIMGGKHTEISEETKNILLESAYFNPITIRKAQKRLRLASESSHRFERGVDFAMILSASVRAQELIKEVAGGSLKGTITDKGGKKLKEKEVILNLDEIPRVLGINIESTKVIELFKRLGFAAYRKAKNRLSVTTPCYRQDLEQEIDLIEEVARLYGYDKIPAKIPSFTIQKTYEEEKKDKIFLEKEAKKILYSLGMNEIVTYALTSRHAIEMLGMGLDENLVRLSNPLSSNQELMRPSLLPEMLEALSWNLNRKNTLLQLFESSKVYLATKNKDEVEEKLSLSLGLSGVTSGNWKEKSREMDFFDLKGIVELFLNSLGIKDYKIEKGESFIFKEAMSSNIKVAGKAIGVFGEVKPEVAKRFNIKQRVYLAEISMEDLLKHANLSRRFMVLPRYPSMKRDISMLVDDSVKASDILEVIQTYGNDLIKSVDIFDLYKGQQIGQGKKSLAYSVEYRSDEKTLKDEEVTQIHKDIQKALVDKLGAQIR